MSVYSVDMTDKLLFYNFDDIVFKEDDIPTIESGKISELNRNKFVVSNRDGHLGVHAGVMHSKRFPIEINVSQSDTDIYSPFIFNINKDFHMCRIIGAPYNGQYAGIGLQVMSPDLMSTIVNIENQDSKIGDISLSMRLRSLGINKKRDVHQLKRITLNQNAVNTLLNRKELKATITNDLNDPVLRNKSLEPIGEDGGSLVFFSSGQWGTSISNKTDAIFSNYFNMNLKQFEDFLDMVAYLPWDDSIPERAEEVRFLITYNIDKSMFYLEPIFSMPVKNDDPTQKLKAIRDRSLIIPAGNPDSTYQVMLNYSQHFNRDFKNQKLIPAYKVGYIRDWLSLVRKISPNPDTTVITFRTPEQLINPIHMIAHYYDEQINKNVAISDIVAVITRYFVESDYISSNDTIVVKN